MIYCCLEKEVHDKEISILFLYHASVIELSDCLHRYRLRIDNSRHGAIPVLWYISRTTIATSCDISNEWAHFSACLGANGILMTFYSKKQQIKYLFFHFYFLNMDILLNNRLPVITFYTGVKNTHMEGTVSQISHLGLSFSFIWKNG